MSLVIFDLDGTLAPVGLPVPEDVCAGLRELEECGWKIALCSGKPLAYLCGTARQLGLAKPALVGENGAAMQLGVDLPPVHHGVLHYPEGAKRKLAELRVSLERDFGGRIWFQPNEHMLTCFPHSEELFEPIARLLRESGAEQSGLTVYRHCDCFDIIPSEINKGAGVRALCGMMGVRPEDCAAVGDHCNDLPMFRAVGTAIAVGGYAPEEAHMCFGSALEAVMYLKGLK